MRLSITFDIDVEHGRIEQYNDNYLSQLWHIAQANPAPHDDKDASRLVSIVGNEIIRRWMTAAPVELYQHQAVAYERSLVINAGLYPKELTDGGSDAK